MHHEADCEKPKERIPHVFALHRQIRMRQATEVVGRLIDGDRAAIKAGATVTVLLPRDPDERAMVTRKLQHFGRVLGMVQSVAS